MRGGVNAEISNLDYCVCLFAFRWNTAKIGAYPRQQFIHAEWLGDIVVGSGIERLNFLLLLVANRQHDDWNLGNERELCGKAARRRWRASTNP